MAPATGVKTFVLVVLAASVLVFVSTPRSAEAAVAFDAGTLSLTGGKGLDSFDLTCVADAVELNGDSTGVACSDVQAIDASLGAGNDNGVFVYGDEGVWTALEAVHVDGQGGNDSLGGTNFVPSTLVGGPGDDWISAGGLADDTLIGGEGIDELSLYTDADLVVTDSTASGAGADTHSGFEIALVEVPTWGDPHTIDTTAFSGRTVASATQSGDEVLTGPANDLIRVMEGVHTVDAGGGTDEILLYAFQSTTQVTFADQHMTGSAADTTSTFDTSMTNIERAAFQFSDDYGVSVDATAFDGPVDGFFGYGDDRYMGGPGNDRIRGEIGRDILNGGKGKDVLSGGADSDYLDGGPNRDRCLGSRWADGFANCESIKA